MAIAEVGGSAEKFSPTIEGVSQRCAHLVGQAAAPQQGVARFDSQPIPRGTQLTQIVVGVDVVRIGAEVPLVGEFGGVENAPICVDLPRAGRAYTECLS